MKLKYLILDEIISLYMKKKLILALVNSAILAFKIIDVF